MKNNCILLVILVLSLLGCKKQNSFVSQEQVNGCTVTHIDIPQQQAAQAPLMLSGLAHNIEVIPLETSEEGLVGAYAKYYIGRSFILVLQSENILLFDRNGHFIRTIARQGKAPFEFGDVRDYCVDEEKELLFILDSWTRSGLKCFHLRDSAYFKPIETVVAENNAVEYLDNGNLLLAPYPCGDVKYYCYEQTTDGQLKANLPYKSRYRNDRSDSKRLIYKLEDEVRYLSSEELLSDDTVFHVLTDRLQPIWIFHRSETKHYRVLGETPDYLFFDFRVLKSKEEEKMEGGSCVTLDYDSKSFYYDKNDGNLVPFEGIMDDKFTGKIWPLDRYAHIQNGKTLYISIPAMSLFQDIEKQTTKEIAVKCPESWKNLVAKMTEEDNPILIVADLN